MSELLLVEKLVTLIKTRYSVLSTESISVNESGWSNLVIIVGGRMVFRFPRTDSAKRTLQIEQRILPALRPTLPIPIPHFVYESSPTDEIPYVAYPLIQGDPLMPVTLRSILKFQQERLACQLGEFLTALHSFPLEKAFPTTLDSSGTIKTWQRIHEKITRTAFPYMDPHLVAWTDHVFTDFLTDSNYFLFSPCLLHNDFKPDHILYNSRQKAISGVIDFGSMWAGDPAYDFVGLHSAYGKEFAAEVIRHYGAPIDHAFFKRINEFYLKVMSFWKLLYGIEANDPRMIQSALEKLRFIAKKDRA
ncbi:phosphotransferase family protein [Brevibacillus centrosporus]|uniref:phosphotransferase family protein n=1 Tax=Brevibacillus centrosporus TaxID=54910 RepID=UPI0039862A3A